jgi:hypothetical protein
VTLAELEAMLRDLFAMIGVLAVLYAIGRAMLGRSR